MGEFFVVRNNDDSEAVVTQLLQQRDDAASSLGVEISGRLIGQQQARLIDERARNGGSLHFAAGQLAGPVAAPRTEADAGEQHFGPLAGDPAGKQRGQQDVFLDAQRRQQAEMLKDKPDLRAADG